MIKTPLPLRAHSLLPWSLPAVAGGEIPIPKWNLSAVADGGLIVRYTVPTLYRPSRRARPARRPCSLLPHSASEWSSPAAAGTPNSISTHSVIDLTARQESSCTAMFPESATAHRATTSANRPGLEVSEFLRIHPHARFCKTSAQKLPPAAEPSFARRGATPDP
jgi:hypothetical protein